VRTYHDIQCLYLTVEYPTITEVWDRFQDMFDVLGDAITYLPAFRAYHWQMLEELYNDNVMYAEIRTSCKTVSNVFFSISI